MDNPRPEHLAGEDWHGTPIVGQSIDGNTTWIRSEDFRFMFSGALEEVKES